MHRFLIILAATAVFLSLSAAAVLAGEMSVAPGEERIEPPLEVLWTYQSGQTRTAPVISSGVLYITGSYDGHVHALDALTGSLKWKYSTGEVKSFVTSGSAAYVNSYDGYIYALDADTGSLKWKFNSGASLLVFSGTVYTGSGDGYLYALDADTGSLKWKYNASRYAVPYIAVSGDVIYMGSGYHVYALDASTGSLRWKYKPGEYAVSYLAASDGMVYAVSEEGILYALDAGTGFPKWKFYPGGYLGISSGVLYMTGSGYYVHAVNAMNGSTIWKYKDEHPIYSSALIGSEIYSGSGGSGDSYLSALDADTGRLKWKYRGGEYVGDVFAVSGNIVFMSASDKLVAVDKETGGVKWKYDGLNYPVVSGGLLYASSRDSVYALAPYSYLIRDARRSLREAESQGLPVPGAAEDLAKAEIALSNRDYPQTKKLISDAKAKIETREIKNDRAEQADLPSPDADGISNDVDFATSINNNYMYAGLAFFFIGFVITIKRRKQHINYGKKERMKKEILDKIYEVAGKRDIDER